MALLHVQSPREVGSGHMQLCGQLCRGVNPYSTSLNAPLEEAMAALPVKRILEFDGDPKAADELIGFWLSEGPERFSVHQRYIFMHSIFRVAINAGGRKHVTILAGELAAEELEVLMMTSLERGNASFVIMTGQVQMEQFGQMLGDYYILAKSKILPFLASLKSENAGDVEEATARIFEEMTKTKALEYISAARRQRSDDSRSIEILDRYERMLTSA